MNKKIPFQPELRYSRNFTFDFDAIIKWIIYRNGIDVLYISIVQVKI